jgi:hypothetical protein
MTDNTNNLVNDLLNILQPDEPAEKPEKKVVKPTLKATIVQKKGGKIANANTAVEPSVKAEPEAVLPKKERIKTEGFLEGVEETVKDTQNAKVVIRKDLYEIFMSIKRAKQVKSVSTLLDHALEDYIKRNSENIKKLLYDNQKHEIL